LLTHVRSNKARLSTTASANDQEFPGHPTDGQKPADAKGRSEAPIFCFRFGPRSQRQSSGASRTSCRNKNIDQGWLRCSNRLCRYSRSPDTRSSISICAAVLKRRILAEAAALCRAKRWPSAPAAGGSRRRRASSRARLAPAANSGAPSPALPLGPALDGTGTGGAKAWLSGAFSVVRFALGYFGSGGGRRRRGRRRTQK
jgi:hypothetical protein